MPSRALRSRFALTTRARGSLTVLTAACLLGGSAQALQLIDARDGVSVEALLSIKEPTRIRIDGAPITDVFGNIFSSHCGGGGGGSNGPGVLAGTLPAGGSGTTTMLAPSTNAAVNPDGEIVIECDRDKGEIYVRPVGEGSKPINLFISSATATYTLVLRRSDTPADTIVLRDRTPAGFKPASTQTPAGPSPSHLRAMKALLAAMASDRVPPDIRVEETLRPVRLWVEAKFSLVRLYEARGLVGEKYLLQNTSDKPMVLAEQEFDREGDADSGQVAGVAIEQHSLRPGESTSIYVIRRGSTR